MGRTQHDGKIARAAKITWDEYDTTNIFTFIDDCVRDQQDFVIDWGRGDMPVTLKLRLQDHGILAKQAADAFPHLFYPVVALLGVVLTYKLYKAEWGTFDYNLIDG